VDQEERTARRTREEGWKLTNHTVRTRVNECLLYFEQINSKSKEVSLKSKKRIIDEKP